MGSVETVVVGEVSVKACLAWVGVELSVRMGLEVEGLGIVYGWGIFGEVQAGMIGKRAGHVRVGVFGGGAGEVCMVERGEEWVGEGEGEGEGLGAFCQVSMVVIVALLVIWHPFTSYRS